MGLSLHNLGKSLGDVLGGVERQINPFDGGATYSNPNPQPAPQPVIRPANNGFNANPFSNPNGPIVGLGADLFHGIGAVSHGIGAVSQEFGNSLKYLSNQSRMATANTPVIGWLERNISDPMAQSMGSTFQRTGQLEQGHNPYHGTGAQIAGQVGEDLLNASQFIPGLGAAEDVAKGAILGAKQGGKVLLKQIGKGVLHNSPIGAGYGVSSTLENNDTNLKDLATNAAAGAGIAGILGGGAPLLGKVGSKERIPVEKPTVGVKGQGADLAAAPKPVEAGKLTVTAKTEPATPAETPTVSTAAAKEKLDNFLTQTARTPQFDPENFNLEANLNKLNGTHKANQLLLPDMLDTKGFNQADLEAAYHYAEDKSHPLTPTQQKIYDEHVKPILDQTRPVSSQLSGTNYAQEENYLPRIAQGKNSRYERYLNDQLQSPEQGSLTKTTPNQKGRVYKAIVDENGNRTVVAINTPKDELGKVAGPKQVTAFRNGKTEVMGPLKRNLPPQVTEFYDPQTRAALEQTAKNLGITHERVVKIKGKGARNAAGVSYTGKNLVLTKAASPEDTISHEIGHQIDEKYGLQDKILGPGRTKSDMIIKKQIAKLQNLKKQLDPKKDKAIIADYDKMIADHKQQMKVNREIRNLADSRMGGSTNKSFQGYVRKGEEKIAVMFQAYLRNPELFKKTAPTVYKQFVSFLNEHPELAPLANIKRSLELTKSTVGEKDMPKVFVDQSGKRYKITEATTKEIEQHTNTTYYKNPIASAALAHVNAVNAKAANDFMEAWKLSPDFADHAMKMEGEGTPPADWRPVDSPYFRGYVFDPQTRDMINRLVGVHNPESSNAAIRAAANAWRGITNTATQFIVINPGVHGMNLYQMASMAAGQIEGHTPPGSFMAFNHDLGILARDSAARASAIQDYLRAGGHFEEYGKDHETVLTKALDAAGLPRINKANATAMSGIDATLRAALWQTTKRMGMKDEAAAVKLIDDFMGRKENIGPLARNIGMFWHWFTTTSRVGYNLVRHPINNKGAITNLAIGFAVLQGANLLWQQATGNKNAHFRNPGEIGFINDVVKAPGEIRQGHLPTVIESHLNPTVTAIANQAYGKDIFTGKDVKTGGDRLANAAEKLIMPVQMASQTQGSKSIPEVLGNEIFGAYEPHAKGNPAAPNPKLPGVSFLNGKGVTPAQGNDPTGYSQTQAYYQTKDAAKSSLTPEQQGVYDKVTTKMRDQNGKAILNGPLDSIAIARDLDQNPAVLKAMQKQEQDLAKKTGQDLDPKWALTGNGYLLGGQNVSRLQVYENYQSQYAGSPERTALEQINPWLKQAAKDRSKFFDTHPFVAGNDVANPATPKAPTFNAKTQSLLDQYDSLTDAKAKSDLINNNPELASAFDQLGQYTNKLRVAQHTSPSDDYPKADPQTETFISAYMNASKAERAGMRNSPLYGSMQQYLSRVTLANVLKQASVDRLLGMSAAESDQKLMKDVASLGYDIHKNSDGTYSFSPGNGGSSSSYRSYGSSSSLNPYKYAVALNAGGKAAKPHITLAAPKITGAKGKTIGKASKPSVSLKKSLV